MAPPAPTSGNVQASASDIATSLLSPSDAAMGQPSASSIIPAMKPTPIETQKALEASSRFTAGLCTSASAKRALTPTQRNTCGATAAAPMPTSCGPMIRATTKAEAKEKAAESAASAPAQRTPFPERRASPLCTSSYSRK